MRPAHPVQRSVAPWGAPPTAPAAPPACVPHTQYSASWLHREPHRFGHKKMMKHIFRINPLYVGPMHSVVYYHSYLHSISAWLHADKYDDSLSGVRFGRRRMRRLLLYDWALPCSVWNKRQHALHGNGPTQKKTVAKVLARLTPAKAQTRVRAVLELQIDHTARQ
eukprot:9502494-Pyramimonas_sp.AAC.1